MLASLMKSPLGALTTSSMNNDLLLDLCEQQSDETLTEPGKTQIHMYLNTHSETVDKD